MARRKRKKKRSDGPSLIAGHLKNIKRGLLEGEKRAAFLAFLDRTLPARQGIYALYDKRDRLYYAGKASALARRLNQHLRDKHGDSWERMTLFHVADSSNVAELEGLVVAIARPPGNTQKPRIGQDLRKRLHRYLREDAVLQIDQAIYPDKEPAKNSLSGRLTTTKLRRLKQSQLKKVLGISQPRVSQLLQANKMRQYIREAGKRDAVLLLLEKSRRK